MSWIIPADHGEVRKEQHLFSFNGFTMKLQNFLNFFYDITPGLIIFLIIQTHG